MHLHDRRATAAANAAREAARDERHQAELQEEAPGMFAFMNSRLSDSALSEDGRSAPWQPRIPSATLVPATGIAALLPRALFGPEQPMLLIAAYGQHPVALSMTADHRLDVPQACWRDPIF